MKIKEKEYEVLVFRGSSTYLYTNKHDTKEQALKDLELVAPGFTARVYEVTRVEIKLPSKKIVLLATTRSIGIIPISTSAR